MKQDMYRRMLESMARPEVTDKLCAALSQDDVTTILKNYKPICIVIDDEAAFKKMKDTGGIEMERARNFDGEALMMRDIGRIEALMDVVEMESERLDQLYRERSMCVMEGFVLQANKTDAVIEELEKSIEWYKKEIRALKEVVGWTE